MLTCTHSTNASPPYQALRHTRFKLPQVHFPAKQIDSAHISPLETGSVEPSRLEPRLKRGCGTTASAHVHDCCCEMAGLPMFRSRDVMALANCVSKQKDARSCRLCQPARYIVGDTRLRRAFGLLPCLPSFYIGCFTTTTHVRLTS